MDKCFPTRGLKHDLLELFKMVKTRLSPWDREMVAFDTQRCQQFVLPGQRRFKTLRREIYDDLIAGPTRIMELLFGWLAAGGNQVVNSDEVESVLDGHSTLPPKPPAPSRPRLSTRVRRLSSPQC